MFVKCIKDAVMEDENGEICFLGNKIYEAKELKHCELMIIDEQGYEHIVSNEEGDMFLDEYFILNVEVDKNEG